MVKCFLTCFIPLETVLCTLLLITDDSVYPIKIKGSRWFCPVSWGLLIHLIPHLLCTGPPVCPTLNCVLFIPIIYEMYHPRMVYSYSCWPMLSSPYNYFPSRIKHCKNLISIDLLYLSSPMILECSMKTFGENCSQPCGNCKDLEKCHHVNGTCIEGCDRGFRGLLCNEGNIILF